MAWCDSSALTLEPDLSYIAALRQRRNRVVQLCGNNFCELANLQITKNCIQADSPCTKYINTQKLKTWVGEPYLICVDQAWECVELLLSILYNNYVIPYQDSCHMCCEIHLVTRSLIKCGTERNGTEWKKLIKHGTELLSQHEVLPRTHGLRSYTHANCSCTRRGLLTRLAGNGWEGKQTTHSILAIMSRSLQVFTWHSLQNSIIFIPSFYPTAIKLWTLFHLLLNLWYLLLHLNPRWMQSTSDY